MGNKKSAEVVVPERKYYALGRAELVKSRNRDMRLIGVGAAANDE